MKFLLDTHALIWLLSDPKRLPQRIRTMLTDARNETYASAVNIFEVASRNSAARRFNYNVSAEEVLVATREAGIDLIDLKPEHAAAVENIANFHGDPFDRLLLAQAQSEGLQLVTHDERLAQYDSRTILF